EHHEIFAKQFDGTDRPRPLQLVDQRGRLPVHPHQLAAGVFRADAGDQVVLLLAHHGASPLKGVEADCSSIEQMFKYAKTARQLGKRLSWSNPSVAPAAPPAPPTLSKASTVACGCCRPSASARAR